MHRSRTTAFFTFPSQHVRICFENGTQPALTWHIHTLPKTSKNSNAFLMKPKNSVHLKAFAALLCYQGLAAQPYGTGWHAGESRVRQPLLTCSPTQCAYRLVARTPGLHAVASLSASVLAGWCWTGRVVLMIIHLQNGQQDKCPARFWRNMAVGSPWKTSKQW